MSRLHAREVEYHAVTVFKPIWMMELGQSYQDDAELQAIIDELVAMPYNVSHYSYMDRLLRFKEKQAVGSSGNLKTQMWADTLGLLLLFQKVSNIFWWPRIRNQVHQYV